MYFSTKKEHCSFWKQHTQKPQQQRQVPSDRATLISAECILESYISNFYYTGER